MVLYMYDGCFVIFEEVIEYYNSGGYFGFNVDFKIRKLYFSDEDKWVLIVFLGILIDILFVCKLFD